MMIQYSLITTALIALFWFTWKLNGVEVPSTNTLDFTNTLTFTLPFSVSRWWDVLIGIIWPSPFIWNAVTDLYNKIDRPILQTVLTNIQHMIAISLGGGAIGGILFGIINGIIISLLCLFVTAVLCILMFILIKTLEKIC